MRTPERWQKSTRPIFISKYFPARIQQDLKSEYYKSSDLPAVDFTKGQGLYLYGPTGTGKTILACEVLLAEARRKWLNNLLVGKMEFITVPSLLQKIKNTFSPGGRNVPFDPYATEQYIIEFYGSIPLLLLDDIGVFAKPSDWVLNTLYLIVNERYDRQLSTIFTSNVDLNGLSELLDDRIPSRIQRMGRDIEKKHWQQGVSK